jgi:hypothetical protein
MSSAASAFESKSFIVLLSRSVMLSIGAPNVLMVDPPDRPAILRHMAVQQCCRSCPLGTRRHLRLRETSSGDVFASQQVTALSSSPRLALEPPTTVRVHDHRLYPSLRPACLRSAYAADNPIAIRHRIASERDGRPGSPLRHRSMSRCHSSSSRKLTTGVCPIRGRPRFFRIT